MAGVSDSVLDAGLTEIKTATRFIVCSSEPTDYADALTKELASKSSPTYTANADYTGGRQFTIEAFSDLLGNATGTGTHYALLYVAGTELMGWSTLSASTSIVSGTSYPVATVTIQAPDPS